MSEPLIFQKLRREVPNERQREFFCSEAMHTAYGGARGGGKSFAMRRKLVMLNGYLQAALRRIKKIFRLK
jgi:hypothetical protein